MKYYKKKITPFNSSQRFRVVFRSKSVDYSYKIPGFLRKKLTVSNKKQPGKSRGKLVCLKRKSAARRYRIIDFFRRDFDQVFIVEKILYDPNRTAFICLVRSLIDGRRKFIICPEAINVGDEIVSSEKNIFNSVGNCMPLRFIKIGQQVHNVMINFNARANIARSAGAFCLVVEQQDRFTVLRLPSGEIKKVDNNCRATIGQVSNVKKMFNRAGKAGRVFHRGIKSKVRGSAMNACDHPFGGGEGKAPKSRPGMSRTGKINCVKKRRNKKTTNFFIVKRRL